MVSCDFFRPAGSTTHLYHRPEDNTTLPCRGASLSDRACSTVDWIYNRDVSQSFELVQKGQVVKESGRAARLSLGMNCSLLINGVTAEDAGFYTCDQKYILNTGVLLSVLTITPSLPDADTNTDGNVQLECTLTRYEDLNECQQNSIRWVNETGSVLRGEGLGCKVTAQRNCSSVLTVTHQSGPNRTFTCQKVDERNNVQIEDHYTPFFTHGFRGWSPLDYVMLTLRIAGLFMIPLTVVVLLLKHRRGNETPPDENNMRNDGDEVIYENVEAPSAATGEH
ncbi:uncharacterized protein LOC133998021 [Scomber scombrus]|uniref:uncharacterized protein LOC133998021 n=1 Tax=Scomber scombrus TaxID=13677 RepID=UPI002DD8C20F|nr:uncharacterized protein LOC133998021 [Scomber scombrus]